MALQKLTSKKTLEWTVSFEGEPSRTYRNKNTMIKTKTNWRGLTANQTQLKRDE